MATSRDRRRRALAVAVAAILAVAAIELILRPVLGGSPYEIRLLTLAGIQALLVLGYQFIFGHAGAFSLAQGTFFGLGAYVAGVLGGAHGWPFLASLPLALLLPVALAALVALPVLRLETHYFALATLGIAQLLSLIAVNWQDVTGGANGLAGIPGIALAGLRVPGGVPLLVLVWSLVAGAALLAAHLMRGGIGLAFEVLREAPLAAAAIGLDGGALRGAAFLLSACYAGGAGALYAHTIGVVSPDALGLGVTITCLTMTVVGGRLGVAGAIIGAVLLANVPEWLRVLGSGYRVAYGVVLLGFIILAPAGILGLLGGWRARPQSLARRVELNEATGAPPGPRQPRTAGPVLQAAGLAKRYGGVVAVAGVDLAVGAGEIVGLIGPNGSGKTTLVNLVAGLDRLDRGTIRLDGLEMTRRPAYERARSGIARSFQMSALAPDMTVLDTVAVAWLAASGGIALRRAIRGARRDLAAARAGAHAILATLGIDGVAGEPCRRLAFGVRRRVEIARALALQPRLLLLDEPAAGLVETERSDLAGQLAHLAATGLGIVVVEHDIDFLQRLAHRLVCLDRGRVIASGPPTEVSRDPAVVAAYFGEPNQ